MTDNAQLQESIIAAIQEKKGKAITIVDLTSIGSPICDTYLIAEGNSNTQVSAITDNIHEYVRVHNGVKPWHIEGTNNALWVALDYGDIIVHIFDRNTRKFYDLEHLWSDAVVTNIPDID